MAICVSSLDGILATWRRVLPRRMNHIGYVLRKEIKWLQHICTGEYVYTIGATRGRNVGEKFMEVVAANRGDMHFSRDQYRDFLGGYLHSHGVRKDVLDLWRLVDAPSNAEAIIARGPTTHMGSGHPHIP